jgi:hypothetical protein
MQFLIENFYVDKILHYGISGAADASANLGDVSNAAEWATWGLWVWQVLDSHARRLWKFVSLSAL